MRDETKSKIEGALGNFDLVDALKSKTDVELDGEFEEIYVGLVNVFGELDFSIDDLINYYERKRDAQAESEE